MTDTETIVVVNGETCRHCCGHGRAIDNKTTGANAERLRKEAGISQMHVAKAMGLSQSYYNDLAKGKRAWSQDLVNKFHAAIDDHRDSLP